MAIVGEVHGSFIFLSNCMLIKNKKQINSLSAATAASYG
jgi:hypothetical protein